MVLSYHVSARNGTQVRWRSQPEKLVLKGEMSWILSDDSKSNSLKSLLLFPSKNLLDAVD